MAQWTSECAILRDLSVAQGRVPVALERTVGAGDKPPSLNISEETEEEFFKHCSPDANVTAAPDLGLIQKMLDMVRDANEWSDEEDTDKALVISKVKAHSSKFIPIQQNTSTPIGQSPTKQIKEKPKKRQRNIALESIFQAIADNSLQNNEIKLRKPDDFINNNNVETKIEPSDKKTPEKTDLLVSKDSGDGSNLSSTLTAAEKVNGWFETQTGSPFPKKITKVTLEAANIVFKKKEKKKKIEKCPKDYLKKLEISPLSASAYSGEYKPSTLANEYYQKYVQQNKFKESVREDIWTKAERKMKEIDEKRRCEALQSLTTPSSASQASGLNLSFEETQSTDTFTALALTETKISRCLDLISLPQHRHRLTGNCVVCEVMKKKPMKPKAEISEEKAINKNNTENEDAINNELEDAPTENIGDVESTSNVKELASLNEYSTKQLADVQITDLINKELTKFVENVEINTKFPENLGSLYKGFELYDENEDLTNYEAFKLGDKDLKTLPEDFKSYVGNEDLNGDTLDVENVYECVSKTGLPFQEVCLSDKSF